MDEREWRGIGASAGRVKGRTWLLPAVADQAPQVEDAGGVIDGQSQLDRLQQAIIQTDRSLAALEEKVRAEQGEAVAGIFAAHRLLLDDPGFTGEMTSRIKDKALLAEQAVKEVADEAAAMLGALDDQYFRERATDIRDVAQQLVHQLAGGYKAAEQFPAEGDWVVVAEDLTPAQTISLPQDRVIAFVVHKGGKTSHAAILARTYGIPAVVGVQDGWEQVAGAAGVELDGDAGWIRELSPSEMAGREFGAAHQAGAEPEVSPGAAYAGITLAANIGNPADIPLLKRFGAQGVGLYRTEFLFMGSALPGEEEQVEAYRSVIAACAPAVAVIRTLDIGGDKTAPALKLPVEKNPFLGVRAIRLCFKNPALFETQLRAIWRASATGPAAVMFPMIASLEELRTAKQYLAKARQAVIDQGHAVGSLQVGMMVEVPAAVWLADRLAREVDFFSIGTNDLTQYSLAVDRENSAVADLYQTYHPAVLGMIAQVTRAAKAAGIWTGICGEAGGDILLAPFFAGLGIDELSMSPGLLPRMRQALAGLEPDRIAREGLVDSILACATVAEVSDILQSYGKTVG